MQQQPTRPLGLSILAVVNFGFGLMNAMSAVQLVLTLLAEHGVIAMPTGLAPELAAAYLKLPVWLAEVFLATAVVKVVLLVWSGVGYFQLRRSARLIGSGYAVVSLAESALAFALYGVGGDGIIGCLYPIYTLLAVNTMFKERLSQ